MGLRDLFRRTPKQQAAPLPDSLTPEQEAEMRQTAREWIAPGFREREDLAVELSDYHDDIEVAESAKLAAAERIVAQEWQRQLDIQATWSGPGDYHRVAAAFDALAEQGVVARMNFTCCQTCGTDEIDDERTALDTDDWYKFREWGYTFFHAQDSERLTDEDARLYLSYSAFRAAPGLDEELVKRSRTDDDLRQQVIRETDAAVGHLVTNALREAGLEVNWDGDTGKRIEVAIREWRKPLPA